MTLCFKEVNRDFANKKIPNEAFYEKKGFLYMCVFKNKGLLPIGNKLK